MTNPEFRYGRPVDEARRRPLLFLDVDGTLLPTSGVQLPQSIQEWTTQWQSAANPHLSSIDRSIGARLLALPCDVVWATAWMNDANVVVAPLLGLPNLPVAELGDVPGVDDPVWEEDDDRACRNWKTSGLVEHAAGRPFIWLDDEITRIDRTWISANHSGAALLRRVSPAVGLTDTDFRAVETWCRTSE